MQADPFEAVRNFEKELCAYTGAPYAVAVNSCTMALLLACAWAKQERGGWPRMFSIPKLTYVGVPMSIINARCGVTFHDEDWQGEYELKQLPDGDFSVWDAARRFTGNMFSARSALLAERGTPGLPHLTFQCVSFHISKILGHSQGGAILHDDSGADEWFRKARFDGRTAGVPPAKDNFDMLGWHAYMSPDVAAALRWKLSVLPRHNDDLPRSDYPDLSIFPIFQKPLAEQQRNV